MARRRILRLTAQVLAVAALLGAALLITMGRAARARQAAYSLPSPDQARALLTADCDYFHAMSPFDLQVRLQRRTLPADRARAVQDYQQLARESVVPWEPAQAAAVRQEAERVLLQVRRHYPTLVLPTVNFIETDGREEGGAAYTRGASIVFPEELVDEDLPHLLPHELFHVISRYNPSVRTKLYRAIGFTHVDHFVPPPSLKRVTNPDGVDYGWRISLQAGGHPIEALPFIYSKRDYSGGNLFDYLQFGLLEVEPRQGRWVPTLDGAGRPLLYNPKQVQGLAEQIGRNTGYIIHPDEILADNFALLLSYQDPAQRPQLAARYDTKLLDKIDTILRAGKG